jgi:hypothetical protein
MALEAIKSICGIDSQFIGKLAHIELFGGGIDVHPVAADPGCGACGSQPRVNARNMDDYRAECSL